MAEPKACCDDCATGNFGNGDTGSGDVGRKDIEICGGCDMVSCRHWSGIVAKGTVSEERRVTGAPLLLDKFINGGIRGIGIQRSSRMIHCNKCV